MTIPTNTKVRRVTYNDLLKALSKLSNQQLGCDVTVENGVENECFAAELRICGETHDSLDEGHPVIYYY